MNCSPPISYADVDNDFKRLLMASVTVLMGLNSRHYNEFKRFFMADVILLMRLNSRRYNSNVKFDLVLVKLVRQVGPWLGPNPVS